MTASHLIRAAAEQDIVEALDYYALQAPHKLAEFEEAIDEVIARVVADPVLYRQRVENIRCAFVRGFPYQLWYVWHDSARVVDVIAFLHGRRDRDHLIEQRRGR